MYSHRVIPWYLNLVDQRRLEDVKSSSSGAAADTGRSPLIAFLSSTRDGNEMAHLVSQRPILQMHGSTHGVSSAPYFSCGQGAAMLGIGISIRKEDR
jgi:hypothetical protein